jgi:hypothetical protein
MAIRYEIDKDNVVLIYGDEQVEPALIQPHDPDGDGSPFASRTEAEAWAETFLNRPVYTPPAE